ncbi:OLC1v1022800C1 [Oldenlandia corymbosa var. corymbosa]|uniref:OLC1v1022800C1 n=1 Tax=Oldenlandia corymbosa var. corymbosa TaxID=529605 RepID=A0AAV1BYP2_OLDCO|nr:OLC1v1022800C1 [Oldenlandia corymbosa var. corymbosa]
MDESAEHHDLLKKSKLSGDEPEFCQFTDDLISNLPDAILCHILSFLATKEAAATSVLSSKWTNLFLLIPNPELDFDDSSLQRHPKGRINPVNEIYFPVHDSEPEEVKESSFIDFVGGVLKRFLQNSSTISEFKLRCQKRYADKCIISWLRSAVMLKVQTVYLCAPIRNSRKVMNCLNGCTSLVELYLVQKGFKISKNPGLKIPSPKKLKLDHIVFSNDESAEQLFRGCPVLENLVLRFCDLLNVRNFRVGIPSLKTLTIVCCHILCDLKIIIDAPKLEILFYQGSLVESFSFTNKLDHIVSLSLHLVVIKDSQGVDEELYDWFYGVVKLPRLINPCSGVKVLNLGEFTIEVRFIGFLPCSNFFFF